MQRSLARAGSDVPSKRSHFCTYRASRQEETAIIHIYLSQGNLSDKVISTYFNPHTINLLTLDASNIHFCSTWEFASAAEPVRQEHSFPLSRELAEFQFLLSDSINSFVSTICSDCQIEYNTSFVKFISSLKR